MRTNPPQQVSDLPTHASQTIAMDLHFEGLTPRIERGPLALHMRGYRVAVEGLQRSAPAGASGALEIRVRLEASSPWWVEAPALERAETPLWTGAVSAEPADEAGASHAVRWRIPFVADAAPVGRLASTFRLSSPGTLRLAEASPETTLVPVEAPTER